jgi:hypothetical protein
MFSTRSARRVPGAESLQRTGHRWGILDTLPTRADLGRVACLLHDCDAASDFRTIHRLVVLLKVTQEEIVENAGLWSELEQFVEGFENK